MSKRGFGVVGRVSRTAFDGYVIAWSFPYLEPFELQYTIILPFEPIYLSNLHSQAIQVPFPQAQITVNPFLPPCQTNSWTPSLAASDKTNMKASTPSPSHTPSRPAN